MGADNVTARFHGAAIEHGPDTEYTIFAEVEIAGENVHIRTETKRRGVKLTAAGALAIAEFILRNVEDE